MILLQETPYSSLIALYQQSTGSIYLSNVEAVKYIVLNTFMPLRVYQQQYSAVLRSGLENSSSQGETIIFIVQGICIGIVLLSAAILMPVFIWVIKDKSYVIRIFADIEDSEIQQMINLVETCDLKRVRYKNKWLTQCKGDEQKYWEKILREQRKNRDKESENLLTSRKNIVNKNISVGTNEKLIIKKKEPEEKKDFFLPHAIMNEEKKEVSDSSDGQKEPQLNLPEEEQKKKRAIKREVMGKLE